MMRIRKHSENVSHVTEMRALPDARQHLSDLQGSSLDPMSRQKRPRPHQCQSERMGGKMSHWIIHLQAAMMLMLVRVNIHIVGGLQAPDICPFTLAVPQNFKLTGRVKGQSTMELLAAYALAQFPIDLIVTDCHTYHILRLRGRRVISWEDLPPEVAVHHICKFLLQVALVI